jgi:hypothetical protein
MNSYKLIKSEIIYDNFGGISLSGISWFVLVLVLKSGSVIIIVVGWVEGLVSFIGHCSS